MKHRKIVTIAGKTGYGKSHLVKTQIALLFDRIIIFDLMSEYQYNDFIVITDTIDFQKYISEHIFDDTLKIILRLSNMNEYEFAFYIIHLAQKGLETPLTVIIEEIWNFASPHYYIEDLENLIRFGRHYSISIIGITQKIGDVGALYLNNSDMIICFNLTDKNDLQRLSSIPFIGEEGSKQVGKLKRYSHIIFENS